MASAANQTQLQQSLAAADPLIDITDDFPISSQININYPVLIRGYAGVKRTLTRQTGYSGYMFSVTSSGNLTLQNMTLDGNKEDNPSARSVISVSSRVTLDSTTIQNNQSTVNGGGITLSLMGAYCEMKNYSVIQNCASLQYGGGIYLNINSTLLAAQSYIADNSSGQSGGGVFMNSNGSATFSEGGLSGNTSQNEGGGIYVNLNGTFTAEGTAIANNTASQQGGGIFANTGTTIILNGGGLSGNQSGYGGGIFLNQAQLQADKITFAGNSVWADGGGLFINEGSTAVLTDSPVIYNYSANGAGLYVTVKGSLEYHNGEFTGNNAGGNGGGLIVDGSAEITDTPVHENYAGNGAGIFINSNGILTCSNLPVYGNIATYAGGGIYLNYSTLSLEDITITNNQAVNGGGMLINGESLLIYNNGRVSRNQASELGGGIFLNELSQAVLTNTPVSQNIAASGGGLYLNLGSKLTYQDAQITANQVSGSGGGMNITYASAELINSSIFNNNAFEGGGIVCRANGNLIFTSGQIYANTAIENGGGLLVIDSALATVNNSSIYENSAGFGAGAFARSGGNLTFSGGEITRNSATSDGGALYLINYGEAHLIAPACVFANTAANLAAGIYDYAVLGLSGPVAIPNGVYLVSEDFLIRIEDSVNGGYVQLDQTPYVFPEPARAPIDVAESTPQYPLLVAADDAAFKKPVVNFEDWRVERNEADTRVRLNVRQSYEINYENLLGANNPNPGSYDADSLPLVLLPLARVAGYCFVGWFEDSEGGQPIIKLPEGTTGNITLYARWRPCLLPSRCRCQIVFRKCRPCVSCFFRPQKPNPTASG